MSAGSVSDVDRDWHADPIFAPNLYDYVTPNPYAPGPLKKCFTPCCEYAACCRAVGRVGLDSASTPWARKRLLGFAAVANVIALAVTLMAACALATSGPVVRNTCWARSTVSGVNATQVINAWNIEKAGSCEVNNPNVRELDLHVYVGLAGVATDAFEAGSTTNRVCKESDTSRGYGQFVAWDDASMCNNINHDYNDAKVLKKYCIACRDSATGLATSVIVAVVTCLPTLQTDVQRIFRAADLNCQKFLAVFVGGIFACINTLIGFR